MSDFHPNISIVEPTFHAKIEVFSLRDFNREPCATEIAQNSMRFPNEGPSLTNVEDINLHSSRQKQFSSEDLSQVIDEVKDQEINQMQRTEYLRIQLEKYKKNLHELKLEIETRDQQIAYLKARCESLAQK